MGRGQQAGRSCDPNTDASHACAPNPPTTRPQLQHWWGGGTANAPARRPPAVLAASQWCAPGCPSLAPVCEPAVHGARVRVRELPEQAWARERGWLAGAACAAAAAAHMLRLSALQAAHQLRPAPVLHLQHHRLLPLGLRRHGGRCLRLPRTRATPESPRVTEAPAPPAQAAGGGAPVRCALPPAPRPAAAPPPPAQPLASLAPAACCAHCEPPCEAGHAPPVMCVTRVVCVCVCVCRTMHGRVPVHSEGARARGVRGAHETRVATLLLRVCTRWWGAPHALNAASWSCTVTLAVWCSRRAWSSCCVRLSTSLRRAAAAWRSDWLAASHACNTGGER